MTRWIGRLLMGVAVIHTGVAVVTYNDTLLAILNAGVFNTVVGNPANGALAWSLLFGTLAFIGGMSINALEQFATMIPRRLGWSLMALGIMGATLVPISGFWVLFPAAVGILRRKQQDAS
jgi:Family of unknown function (DUF6463)